MLHNIQDAMGFLILSVLQALNCVLLIFSEDCLYIQCISFNLPCFSGYIYEEHNLKLVMVVGVHIRYLVFKELSQFGWIKRIS